MQFLSRAIISCVLPWFLFSLAGCGCAELDYACYAVGGELQLLASAVPIEDGLTDTSLTDDEREKLELVIEARDYAADVVGLNVASSYQTFVNFHGEPMAWNLSASAKDAIEAYTWTLPFVGEIAYLGYFDLDRATVERDRLVSEGYDTMIYEVDAFSTLGLLPDPVSSSLFRRAVHSLVDTVFHELLHNTIWTGRDVVFDESLAVFVGRTAGMEFLEQRFGADSEQVQQAREKYEDTDRFNAFLDELRVELETLYNSPLSREEKIEARQPIFDTASQRLGDEILPTLHYPETYEQFTTTTFNNAFMLVNVRYHTDFELFEAVFDKAGRDWGEALSVFSQAAGVADPFAYLATFLEE